VFCDFFLVLLPRLCPPRDQRQPIRALSRVAVYFFPSSIWASHFLFPSFPPFYRRTFPRVHRRFLAWPFLFALPFFFPIPTTVPFFCGILSLVTQGTHFLPGLSFVLKRPSRPSPALCLICPRAPRVFVYMTTPFNSISVRDGCFCPPTVPFCSTCS